MRWVLPALVVLLLPVLALADGKFYSTPVALAANVTIPDQRALIHFTNGIERLVIETRFTGSGTNFAWVVPLPSQPIVEEASAGVFPTLEYLFRPEITHNVPHHSLLVLALLGFGYLLLYVRPTSRIQWLDVLACLLIFLGVSKSDPMLGFIVLLGSLICVIWIRIARRPAGVVFIVVGFIILLAIVGLPSLAKSRASASSKVSNPQQVSVLDRKLVGVFETTTIASREPTALLNWLRERGYVVTSNSEPVIASYLRDGWIFVAAKIRRDKPEQETSTPHPLSFTFKTDKPVYPVRLTGVDNGPLKVELNVFGPSRAKAANFQTTRCTRPDYPQVPSNDSYSWSYRLPTRPTIVHPLLRQWLEDAPVATKLSATLSPAQMKEDVWLEWTSFAERGNRVFSNQGAVTTASNWGAGVLAGLLLLTTFGCRGAVRRPIPSYKLLGFATLVGIATAAVIWLALPKTQIKLMRRGDFMHKPKDITYHLSWELKDASSQSPALNLSEARTTVQRIINVADTNSPYWKQWVRISDWSNWQNYYLGGPLREEDSPGNYSLREADGRIQFLGYDGLGAEHVFHEWPMQKK